MELLTKMSGDSDKQNSLRHHLSLAYLRLDYNMRFFSMSQQSLVGQGLHIIEASDHTQTYTHTR